MTLREVTIRKADGSVVCERCAVADRFVPRLRGLLGRTELVAGTGLLLRPASSIHTFFMRFPIDVVFLDRDYVVVGIRAALAPWRVAARRRARSTLELAAGECARREVEVGDRLVVSG